MCVVTSFYQRPASRVYYFAFFNLRNLLYLIRTKEEQERKERENKAVVRAERDKHRSKDNWER